MKGYVRIGSAILLGALIILGALYLRGSIENTAPATSDGEIVAAPEEREFIAEVDSDGDGIKDWEESLTERVFRAVETPENPGTPTISSEEYAKPVTFTGKFAEAFFQDYMAGKITGDGVVNQVDIVTNAVSAIEENTGVREFTPLDIVIVDDSNEALKAYGNEVVSIMTKYSIENENEALILERALATNDPAELEKLIPIREVYEKMLADSLLIPTPTSAAEEHLALLAAYEALRADIAAMEQAFTDPLYTLARMKRYQSDALGLFTALSAIAEEIKANSVIYTKDEPGSFFYSFGT